MSTKYLGYGIIVLCVVSVVTSALLYRPSTPAISSAVSQRVPSTSPITTQYAPSAAPVPSRSLATPLTTLIPNMKGSFVFPAPYNTQAVRITDASDCAGKDCVEYAGYSYWRNMNNSTGSSRLLMVVGLSNTHGGEGVTLFSYDKNNGEVKNLGPIFKGTPFEYKNAEGVYFGATASSKIYFTDDMRIVRFDVLTRKYETVFNSADEYGTAKYLWQMNSSDDDRVYSATLRARSTSEMLGCLVYRSDTDKILYYAKKGDFDECQIDRSGHWLVIKEQVDGKNGEDNVIINIDTGEEKILLDEDGAAGHSDMGYGYMVAQDNWSQYPGAVKVWQFDQTPLEGTLVYRDAEWWKTGVSHISHTNAHSGDFSQQYACNSSASSTNYVRANDIICYRLDGSMKAIVVAPTITDLNGAGSMYDDAYSKSPKGNLDPTGEYFFWTTNIHGSGRLDAFIVKVPKNVLQ